MATTINRAPWNALIDDSGQNLDGSIWNKAAIKTVLLDPIDASFATSDTLLTKAAGTDTNTANHSLVNFVVPPLGYNDSLRVLISVFQNAAACSGLYLSAVGDVAIVRLDDIGGGALAANASLIVEIVVRAVNGNPRYWLVKAHGGVMTAAGQLTRLVTALPTIAHWINGGWSLSIDSAGFSAGGSAIWTWSVRKE